MKLIFMFDPGGTEHPCSNEDVKEKKMSGITRTVLYGIVLLIACSAGLLHAEEIRTPTPEEFRELVKQYGQGGSPAAGQGLRPALQGPKGVEEYKRAVSLHTKKGATAGEFKEAAQLYQKAADAGIIQAQSNLALLYLEGKGVRKDLKKALTLLNAASKKGEPQADLTLARLYLGGKDVKLDEKKGEQHLNLAAKTGNPAAVKMVADYKEWKKKNDLAMKEYQEILKKAQFSQVLTNPVVQPVSKAPKVSVQELLPAATELPFPGLPGQAHIGLNPLLTPPTVPAQPAAVSAPPAGSSTTPTPSFKPSGESEGLRPPSK